MEVQIQEKRKWRKYLHSKFALAILLVLIVVLAKASFTAHIRKAEVAETANRVSLEEKELLARKAFLEQEIAKLHTVEGRESELRKKYGVAKSGEQMAVIIEAEPVSGIASSTKKGWFSRTIDFFKFK